jgi:hypothetical protein
MKKRLNVLVKNGSEVLTDPSDMATKLLDI